MSYKKYIFVVYKHSRADILGFNGKKYNVKTAGQYMSNSEMVPCIVVNFNTKIIFEISNDFSDIEFSFNLVMESVKCDFYEGETWAPFEEFKIIYS